MTKAAGSTLTAVLIAALALVLMAGCTKTGPIFVDGGQDYTSQTVLGALDKADTSSISSRPTSEGAKLRHDALAALRREGSVASSVADLLTRTFPSTTSGVPVYVERATYAGKTAIVVVEATGPASGSLDSKRLWVVGEDGDILFAGSR